MNYYNTHNVAIFDFRGYKQIVDPGMPGLITPRPDYHILAEGDSWFHVVGNTGAFKPRNLLDTISFNKKPTAIANLAKTGDTITHITQALHDGALEDAIKYRKWDLIMLSAGGNDLIDALTEEGRYLVNGRFLSIIKQSSQTQNFKSFINAADLNTFKNHIIESYSLFNKYKGKTRNEATPVLIHTYDYPTPNNAKAKCVVSLGPWLFKALTFKKVPEAYWYDISDFLFNELRDTLISLKNIAPSFNIVKTSDTLDRADKNQKGNSKDWLNEIHPNAAGLKKIGEKLSVKINTLI